MSLKDNNTKIDVLPVQSSLCFEKTFRIESVILNINYNDSKQLQTLLNHLLLNRFRHHWNMKALQPNTSSKRSISSVQLKTLRKLNTPSKRSISSVQLKTLRKLNTPSKEAFLQSNWKLYGNRTLIAKEVFLQSNWKLWGKWLGNSCSRHKTNDGLSVCVQQLPRKLQDCFHWTARLRFGKRNTHLLLN